MAIFKCKICGGSLEIDIAQSVAICEYCGTKQTLPKLDNERRANLYDRANHFRRNNDFDKAMGIYENILNEDNTDAEAYWSIVLCRYGIEYVEDPATHKRVPTVNRAQFTSIFDDEDYKSAIANADGYQREIYEEEANAINEIQKGILAISQKEEPFDVFVCYKETDTSGRRTQDSVLATELYHELTREGFKVFFSRITLEDKLGVAYEPYIFAALHSAKVMVVIGTRSEHFNAVWVKNEWSRYLGLIKNGAKKTLIPAYRDMDPYDLPEEFSHLQAQDMSKLGFMQDLTRGIKKIVEAETPKATVKETIAATAAAINVAPLLKRAFMFLEDGEFDRADDFCEQVLNQDPENAEAYLGKLMAELHIKRQADLANCSEPFDNNKNYQKAVRFADSALTSELKGYVATIKDRNTKKAEEARKESLYLKAMDDYKSYDISRLQSAINAFTSLGGYKDSDERIRLCQVKIDQIKIKEENDRIERERLAEEKRIADEKTRLEKQRQAEIDRIEAEKRAKRNKKIAMSISPIVVAFIAFIIILNSVIIPNGKYNNAVALMNDGKYQEAISAFEALEGYKDSNEKIIECNTATLEKQYNEATNLFEQKKYSDAILIFNNLGNYKDSKSWIKKCDYEIIDIVYQDAFSKFQQGNYEKAKEIFSTISSHRDASEYVTKCSNILSQRVYDLAVKQLNSGDWLAAAKTFYSIKDYSDSKQRCFDIWYAKRPMEYFGRTEAQSVALLNNGKIIVSDEVANTTSIQSVSSWSNIVQISGHGDYLVGLTSNGTIQKAGIDDSKLSPSKWNNLVQVSVGSTHVVGLKADGTVIAEKVTSYNYSYDGYNPNDVSEWSDIVAIDAFGSFHTVGIKADGTVVAVGQNGLGQCEVSGWTDIVSVYARGRVTVGIKADGSVVWTNSNYDLSSWKNIVAIGGSSEFLVGLTASGEVLYARDVTGSSAEYWSWCNEVTSWKNIVEIYASANYICGVKNDGSIEIVGSKNYKEIETVSQWTNIKHK